MALEVLGSIPGNRFAGWSAFWDGFGDLHRGVQDRERHAALFQQVVAEAFDTRGLDVEYGEQISAHHNYVAEETLSDGTELIVTRKGAIRAGGGEYRLIPGSMGTGSYVVKGLGNEASYWSASHGTGRKMSRTKAKRTFTVEDLAAETAGVECARTPE